MRAGLCAGAPSYTHRDGGPAARRSRLRRAGSARLRTELGVDHALDTSEDPALRGGLRATAVTTADAPAWPGIRQAAQIAAPVAARGAATVAAHVHEDQRSDQAVYPASMNAQYRARAVWAGKALGRRLCGGRAHCRRGAKFDDHHRLRGRRQRWRGIVECVHAAVLRMAPDTVCTVPYVDRLTRRRRANSRPCPTHVQAVKMHVTVRAAEAAARRYRAWAVPIPL